MTTKLVLILAGLAIVGILIYFVYEAGQGVSNGVSGLVTGVESTAENAALDVFAVITSPINAIESWFSSDSEATQTDASGDSSS